MRKVLYRVRLKCSVDQNFWGPTFAVIVRLPIESQNIITTLTRCLQNSLKYNLLQIFILKYFKKLFIYKNFQNILIINI